MQQNISKLKSNFKHDLRIYKITPKLMNYVVIIMITTYFFLYLTVVFIPKTK